MTSPLVKLQSASVTVVIEDDDGTDTCIGKQDVWMCVCGGEGGGVSTQVGVVFVCGCMGIISSPILPQQSLQHTSTCVHSHGSGS